MTYPREQTLLDPVTASTQRFVDTVRGLSRTDVTGESLVPPWTRGHVITHVARAADSLCRLLFWAGSGFETPQYASMDARAAEIEAGAIRPVDELADDVVQSAERFDTAVRGLAAPAWHQEVRTRTGELRTPASLVSIRLRELEVHHVDLARGYTCADVPGEAARWIIEDLVEAQRGRPGAPALRIEATDTGLVLDLAAGGPTVSGTQAELLGWLTGRASGARLVFSAGGPVPPAPHWI
ncbi:maleylpyruvate isomerase family mycothiol-dependent enzyme [Streptomyces sp. NPDC049916]|uniref:maleylpyruvate isomerase family mycothiol-dependent enzyme n=1 Tax=Streptomyces sp. NPDC049916 TaxID=3155156 RepID=UPI003442F7B9